MTASINLEILSSMPARLLRTTPCSDCRQTDVVWNAVLAKWQCWACRTCWAEKETKKIMETLA